jgi:hypothetical protein
MPRAKFAVPSMGSISQTRSPPRPPSDDRVFGIAGVDRLADEPLDFAVHRREDVVATLHRRRGCSEGGMRKPAGVASQIAAEFESVHRRAG